jgi:hypothetical protein
MGSDDPDPGIKLEMRRQVDLRRGTLDNDTISTVLALPAPGTDPQHAIPSPYARRHAAHDPSIDTCEYVKASVLHHDRRQFRRNVIVYP